MKNLIFLSASFFLILIIACDNKQNYQINNLNCDDYWSQVAFSDFCGLNPSYFEFNNSLADICNADQNSSYPFDDRVSIRVYNHFSSTLAQEEYNDEEAYYAQSNGYSHINNLGDNAFAVITTEFGQLDGALIIVVKDTYTVSLDVNGKAHNGANNCFDESSVVEFARALISPL